MNLIDTTIGGVPMWHGAGGVAGHVRLRARTGGALVILGVVVLLTGLFFSMPAEDAGKDVVYYGNDLPPS